jgi:hypothetical protein
MEAKKAMSETKFPYGKPVKLLVDYQGYPDGRLVQFEIRRKRAGKEEKVCEVYGATRGGKGVGIWNPDFKERAEFQPLRKGAQATDMTEKYFFVARIDDKEVKSGDIIFTHPLKIFLKDAEGNPLNGARFTITFSNGSKRRGEFNNGVAEFEDAPAGKFELELDEDYEFAFED